FGLTKDSPDLKCNYDFSHLSQCRLRYCYITDEGCSAMASALKSNPSHQRELKLSGNKLGDSGVKNLSDLLMNTQCKLEKLELVSLYSTAVTVRLKFTVYFHKVTMKLKLIHLKCLWVNCNSETEFSRFLTF
uniref:SPRY-associated domain-containing protein n=1 Tax=Sinocyclocheilus rhinocerous TaxID=307959 RepID=A0A673H7D9_9TELE